MHPSTYREQGLAGAVQGSPPSRGAQRCHIGPSAIPSGRRSLWKSQGPSYEGCLAVNRCPALAPP